MPHPESEHGLRVQLATALRERDEFRADRDYCAKQTDAANAMADECAQKLAAMEKYHEFAVTQSQEALAAARRECAKKDEALDRCHDLFSDIRGDWTDPRSQCREGMAVCRAALAAPAAASGEEKA